MFAISAAFSRYINRIGLRLISAAGSVNHPHLLGFWLHPLWGHVTGWQHDNLPVTVHYFQMGLITLWPFFFLSAGSVCVCVFEPNTTVVWQYDFNIFCTTHTHTHTHTYRVTEVRRLPSASMASKSRLFEVFCWICFHACKGSFVWMLITVMEREGTEGACEGEHKRDESKGGT